MQTPPDKRLVDRSIRKGATRPEEFEDLLETLPDLSDNLRQPSDAEVEALREELIAESTGRAERIQRQLLEDRTPRPQALPPVVPFDADL
jgi:hypothetical protein